MNIDRRGFFGGLVAAAASGCATSSGAKAGPARFVPKADVFVAGAGPAGFVAAIAAARGGAKVTLAESFGFPGGMATAGLVGPISKFNFAGRRVVGGIAWEFVERMAALGGAIADLPKGNVPFEAEVYRRVAREMLEEAGVRCLWQTQVCGEPELAHDGAIRALTLSTGGFLSRIEANRFIDCTASGAIVGHHGFGAFRSQKGAAQPLSLCFILGGVDTDNARVLVRNDNERSRNAAMRDALEKALAAGGLVAAEPAAFASMRVQAQCMAMGEAAGATAAFNPDEDVRQLDFAAIANERLG